jgi:dephospho-CoA kinase
MIKIAVTGGIACGKSTVGTMLMRQGVAVCDSDVLAHEAMRRGAPAFSEVLEAFGGAFLDERTGELDRTRLGVLVFSDREARERLNAIVHPHVHAAWVSWMRATDPRGVAAVLIPLLFEAGYGTGWDAVLCVAASGRVQRSRLAARGLDPDAVAARISAQMPMEEKMARSDCVLINDGSLELLEKQLVMVMSRIREMDYAN